MLVQSVVGTLIDCPRGLACVNCSQIDSTLHMMRAVLLISDLGRELVEETTQKQMVLCPLNKPGNERVYPARLGNDFGCRNTGDTLHGR